MEIVDCNAGLLTHYEVLQILKEPALERYNYEEHTKESKRLRQTIDRGRRARQQGNNGVLTNKQKKQVLKSQQAQTVQADHRVLEQACWIRAKALQHLESQPAGQQKAEQLQAFLEGCEQFQQTLSPEVRLSQLELCQLVDLCPSTLVEYHKVVEECEDRFLEIHTKQLQELVAKHLPQPETDNEEGEGDAEYDEGLEEEETAQSDVVDPDLQPVESMDELADEQGAFNNDNDTTDD